MLSFKQVIKELRHDKDWVLVPSDKTSAWVPTQAENYINWMNEHLRDKCKEVNNPELAVIYEKLKARVSSSACSVGFARDVYQ